MTGHPPDGLAIRRARPDELAAITDLLHRAYAPLAARGMRYLASWQPVETTAERIEGGECLVAEIDGAIVGTITWHPPERARGHPIYDRPDVAAFFQFCVEPDRQGGGIARALLAEVERRAAAAGARELACDTADVASDLIAFYEHLGYRVVDRADWRPVTNYESVILSKQVRP